MKKRMISFLLVVSLLFSIVPRMVLGVKATEPQKGDGWGNWSDYVLEDTVVIYPVQGGNVYFGQMNPEWLDVDVTEIELLCADSTITSAQIPDTINGLIVAGISEFAFIDCVYLESVYLPATIDLVWGNCFMGCTNLKEICIADGNPNCYTNDGVLYTKGFNDWTDAEVLSLEYYPATKQDTEFAVPHGVTSIAHYAFGDAVNLRSISIPNSISDIQSGAFGDSYSGVNFTDIYYEGSEEKWKRILVGNDYGYETIEATIIHFNRYESFEQSTGNNSASTFERYTIADIERLVAEYYNGHYTSEENPGKYVVFSGETTVNGDICTVVVRFQGDNATMANALVADVRVNMTTGEMFVDGALLGSLFKNQNERKIVAYTAFPESTIGTNQEVKIMFSLYADNVLVPIENYMIDYSKSGVLEQIGSVDSEGSRIITFKGLGPGTVDVNFTDIDTNAAKKLSITVEDQCNYFRCSAFPIPDESIGSIYIADYSCKANENGTHDISFNAYNASYAYGVVEVYSEDGLLIRCEPLEPKSDGSGMEKVANGFKWVWEDIKDLFDGDTAFYKKDKNAKHTPVNLKNVPENAEIIITSDGEASGFATLYTGVDVFVRTVFAVSSIDLKTEGQVKTVKELMSALVDALIKSISHDEIEGGIKEGLIKEATKSISTSIAYASSVDSITEIYQTVSNLFQDLDIDAEGIMLNVLKGMGYGVADTLFTTAVPLYKIVNFVDLVLETAWPLVDYDFNVGRGKMEIHVCKHGLQNYVANNSVTITQQSEFSVATVLDAYIVEADDEIIPLEEPIAEEMTHFEVYNITLRTNGVEVQPDGDIEVRLPVPVGADGENCVVYRIEDDGGKTLLPSTYKDGFVTFTTSHLSYYIVGEPVDTDITNELDDHFNSNILYIASAVLVLILVAVLFCRKKAKN